MFFDRKMITSLYAVCVFVLCGHVAIADTRNISIGMAATDGAVTYTFEANQLGGFEHATVYTTLGKEGLEYAKFPRDLNILLVLRIPHEGKGGNLRKIKVGMYDEQLRKLAQKINADGRKITIRVMPEFNGHWYSWSIYNKDNNSADFVPAWIHVVDVIRSETKLVQFDLNYNRFSSEGGRTNDFEKFFPGREYVDRISISSYNRCGIVAGNDTPHSFEEEFAPAYDAILAFAGPDIPINVAETSTTTLCGVSKKEWFTDLFDSIQTRFTRVSNITFFFTAKQPGTASNDIVVHWDLVNSAEVGMFRKVLRDFRKRMGITPPALPKGEPIGPWKTEVKPEGKETYVLPQKRSYQLPWRFRGKVESIEGDAEIPGKNTTSGESYGTTGARAVGVFEQGIVFPDKDTGLLYGIKGSIEGDFSTNDARHWDNVVKTGIRFDVCKDKLPGVDFASFSRMCAFISGSYSSYLVPVSPEQQNDTRIWFGVEVQAGGDWTNPTKK